MVNIMKLLTALMFLSTSIMAQQQEGYELAESFPQLSPGAIEVDLPADGQWWDRNDSGWGINIETQSRYDSPSGFFIFVTAYIFDEDGNPTWLAGGAQYEPSEPYQWRDSKNFSNMPWGHNDEPVMADMMITLGKFRGGSSFGRPNSGSSEPVDSQDVRFVFKSPTEVTIYPENGDPHTLTRFSWRDDSVNPTLDWIKDYSWHVISSVGSFGTVNSGSVHSKSVYNQNASLQFKDLDISSQDEVREFVGHKSHYKYYISNNKFSLKTVSFFDQATPVADLYAPYINGYNSNKTYALLVHDPQKNHMSLFTVAGEPTPGNLRPDAGLQLKFRANINPDADVIDFYPLRCEGTTFRCENTFLDYSVEDHATFSPKNVHRSVLKMFKIKTGAEAFMYQPNTGESDTQSTTRVQNQMIQDGLL